MMSVWSQTSNPSQERFSQEPPRTSRMVLAWTSFQAASGGESTNEHFLMSASSTRTLPPTEAARSHPATASTKVKKKSLRAADPRGRACVLHSPGLLRLWGPGQRGYYLLQEPRFPPGREKRQHL